ncbi:MAG TPA: TetR-like C-terminal domain-containing protein [Baekduia sp.]|nr:TetR-like C-terminal domain-containing protein [Baekduia sp.]
MADDNAVMAGPQAGPRDRLLQAAAALLEAEGPEALQARRLTREIGTSTMALYTHFGGLPGLVEALVRQGLARFAAHVRQRAPQTGDPMADLLAGGIAYSQFALANPQLYRLMFGLAGGARMRGLTARVDEAGGPWALPEGQDAFSVLLRSVERVIAAGRIREQDALAAATQVLSMTHGYVLLVIGGFVDDPVAGLRDVAFPMTVNLMVGLGDERSQAERSLASAVAARGLTAAS